MRFPAGAGEKELGPLMSPAINLEWKGPVLEPVLFDANAKQVEADREENQACSNLVRVIAEVAQNENISIQPLGNYGAYSTVSNHDDFPEYFEGKPGKARFRKAFTRLLYKEKRLQVEDYKSASRHMKKRVLVSQ